MQKIFLLTNKTKKMNFKKTKFFKKFSNLFQKNTFEIIYKLTIYVHMLEI